MAMTDATGDDPDVDVPELDPLAREILFALDGADGGRLTTTDLKEQTGATNSRILYRIRNHLVPADLVEAEQPAAEEGRVPPKRATITAHGRQVAMALDGIDVDPETVGERPVQAELERLSAEVARLQDRVDTLEEREFDLLRAGMLGVRDYLVEEADVDRHRLAEYVQANEDQGQEE